MLDILHLIRPYHRPKEDVFGAYMLIGAEYDGDYDIPYVEVSEKFKIPDNLISYEKLASTKQLDGINYVHFYQKDFTFDGLKGIWVSTFYDHYSNKGFNLTKLENVHGIICPDFSLYNDMPEALKIWNVYRSRVIGYYFNKIGIVAIPNIRWTDANSYRYAFSGIRKNSVVAVSTLGCLRKNEDKCLFIPGLEELILRLEPKLIILYGSLSNDVKLVLDRFKQNYIYYPSQISTVMEKTYGNEIK